MKYSCDVCNESFSDQKNLKRHKRQSHEENSFTCEKCKKTLSRKDTLQKHERTCCINVANEKQ